MICFIPFVRPSFPYWLCSTDNPVYLISTRVHVGCDRSAEDAYSSMAPDHTFQFVEIRVVLQSSLYLLSRL
jgi:hypothetical protein